MAGGEPDANGNIAGEQYAEGVTDAGLAQMVQQAGSFDAVLSQVTATTSLADVAESMGVEDTVMIAQSARSG